ncbi:MAG: hypothetical protein EOO73_13130 [Myxococcales bacterium]|nr:MAG: hypothetical protein EOO73_13130 [Myxococcales bacterium]
MSRFGAWVAIALSLVSCRRPAPGPVTNEASSAASSTVNQPPATASPVPSNAERRPTPARSAMDPRRAAAFLNRVCVTEGEFAERLTVKTNKMRCVDGESSGDGAKLRFRYEGVTAERTALKSGAIREQLGIKLRARDTCNSLYVMWRFAPTPSVVVSFKDNPAESTHGECENRGYTNVRPTLNQPPPPVQPGSEYELSARIEGARLRAWIDGQLVWDGELPAGAAALVGPAGVRSDNVQWSLLDFDATESAKSQGHADLAPSSCRNRR